MRKDPRLRVAVTEWIKDWVRSRSEEVSSRDRFTGTGDIACESRPGRGTPGCRGGTSLDDFRRVLLSW